MSWKDKMESVVHREAFLQDLEAVALPCAEIADQAVIMSRDAAKGEGKTSIAPLWSAVVPRLIEWFFDAVRTMENPAESDAAKLLLQCAEVADLCEDGRIIVYDDEVITLEKSPRA